MDSPYMTGQGVGLFENHMDKNTSFNIEKAFRIRYTEYGNGRNARGDYHLLPRMSLRISYPQASRSDSDDLTHPRFTQWMVRAV